MRLRSTASEPWPDIAVTDLLPAGFELVRGSLPQSGGGGSDAQAPSRYAAATRPSNFFSIELSP